jgi:transketolase
MDNKQQTAVEWFAMKLAEKLGMPNAISFYVDNQKEILQAKDMEKEQIAKAFDDGDYNYHYSRKTGNDFEDGKEYFNEVYG